MSDEPRPNALLHWSRTQPALTDWPKRFFARWIQGPHRALLGDKESNALVHGLVFLALLTAVLALIGWSVDFRVAELIQQTANTASVRNRIFSAVTLLGTSGYMLGLSALLTLLALVQYGKTQPWRLRAGFAALATRATCFFVIIACSGLMVQVFKHLIGRARPRTIETLGAFHFDAFSMKASLASFPSGHTTTAFAAATALSFFAPRWHVPLFIGAALIGLSRVMIGAHYPSDVLGGMVLGVVSAIVVARFFARRGIGFRVVDGKVQRRGEGAVGPAIKSLLNKQVSP